ncbi:MAG TPA: hypothetical protein VF101_12350 [Gaiellaceae bacterium]
MKAMLRELPQRVPDLLAREGINASDWDVLLRAAVESLRGTFAATTSKKRRFLEGLLEHGVGKAWSAWSFVGTENRQDYRVDLADGTSVCIEAKGCPDGNNTTIWDRPGWADEFIVWCLCPESLVNQPGEGTWSGVATRLLPKEVAERQLVDALVFYDSRCGTDQRRCPKGYGVVGLRRKLTTTPSQTGTTDWLPPPSIYLFPRTLPNVRTNQNPPLHTVSTCTFADALLGLFGVPVAARPAYVYDASARVRGTSRGTQLRVVVTSRCWPDGEERQVAGNWKSVRRE